MAWDFKTVNLIELNKVENSLVSSKHEQGNDHRLTFIFFILDQSEFKATPYFAKLYSKVYFYKILRSSLVL